MSLSSLIVQREVATTREVEESLARQVLYGGDLLLNLFEIARPDETRLSAVLAEAFSLEALPGGELAKANDRALALVPADMAKRSVFLPMAVEGDTLTVAVAEPLPISLENELAFALGVRVVQRAAPGFRVLEAIARDYGLPLDRRVDRLLVRIANPNVRADEDAGASASIVEADFSVRQPPKAPSLRPSPVPAAPEPVRMPEQQRRTTNQGMPVVTPEMIAAALKAERGPSSKPNATPDPGHAAPHSVASPLTTASPVMEPARTPPPVAPVAALAATDANAASAPHSEHVAHVAPIAPFPPAASLAPAAPPAPRTIALVEELVPLAPIDLGPPSSSVADAALANAPKPDPTRVHHAAKAPRPARRRRGPLVIDAAKRELDEATDRDTVLDVFFDFSRQFFDYSALFVVHGDLAEGRDSFGDGASREKVAGIGVPLELPSILQTTRNNRTVVQMIPTAGLDHELLADLGRPEGAMVAIVPVVVRARVVALLLGDSGSGGVEVDALTQVASFAPFAVAAFERLIVRRKLAGQRGSVPPPAMRELISPPTLREGSGRPPPSGEPALAHVPLPPLDDDATPMAPIVHLDSNELTPIKAVDVAPNAHGDGPAHSMPATTRREGAQLRPSGPPPPLPPAAIAANAAQASARRASEPPPSAPPATRISVPPHRPPSSHEKLAELPSIIVDVDAEFGALVEKYITSGDEADYAELVRQGQRAMPAIMAKFPGPIRLASERLAKLDEPKDDLDVPFRASDCGPILQLVAGQRRVALPFILQRADSTDDEQRFWGTFLLYELPYGEAAATLLSRLFDAVPRIRKVARFASRTIAESGPHLFLDALGKAALSPATEPKLRLQAIETLGELRHGLAVPVLVEVLALPSGAKDPESPAPNAEQVIEAARDALRTVTRQDFGSDPRQWMAWWSASSGKNRVEWLIDALASDSLDERRAAGDELKAITKEYFGFDAESAKRERERAQQRYKDWWVTEGRLRFRRD